MLIGSGIVLIWLPFLIRILTGTSALAGLLEHDVGFQWIPFKEYNRWAIGQGYFPLWCPYVFAGMPFLAFSHTQVLYPLGWMLTFFDYAQAVNFYYPLHLSIGFLGLYLLLTNLGISRFVSFLISLCTVSSGMFFYFIHFLPVSSSNFWGIWFFYFLVKLSQTNFSCAQTGVSAPRNPPAHSKPESPLKAGSLKNLLGLSIALCLEILGGNIESMTYQLFLTPFFMLILLGWNQKIKSAAWILVIPGILLGVFLACAQFLPLFEYSRFFLRSAGYTFQGFESRVLPYQLAGALLFPVKNLSFFSFPTPAPYFYLGLLSAFFPFYAVLANKKYRQLFLLSLFTLLFSFGSFKALDWITYHTPFLNRYGAQEHCFFVFQIFWAILAGAGIEEALKENRRGMIWFFAFAFLLVSCGELFLENLGLRITLMVFSGAALAGLLALSRKKVWPVSRRLSSGLLLLIFFVDLYWLALSNVPKHSPELYRLPESLKQFQKMTGKTGARCIAVSSLGVNDPELLHHLGMRTRVGTIDGWITTPPLDFAKFLDLIDPRSVVFQDGKIQEFGFNVHFRDGKFVQDKTFPLLDLLSLKYFLVRGLNLKFASPYSFSKIEPKIISSSEPRTEGTLSADHQLILSGDLALRYPVYLEKPDRLISEISSHPAEPSSFLTISLQARSRWELIYAHAANFQKPETISLSLKDYSGQPGELIFAASRIKAGEPREIILSDPRIENPARPIQRIFQNELEILENREAFPEAFIVHNCEWFPDPDLALPALKQFSQWDLAKEIILAQESRTGKIVQQTGEELRRNWIDPFKLREPVAKVESAPDRLVYRVYLSYPGYLFLNHQYLPGWKAYVDGAEWKIEKADYCFRAVFLEKGEHQVEFRYQPVSFRIGLWFGLSTWAVFLFFGIVLTRKKILNKE